MIIQRLSVVIKLVDLFRGVPILRGDIRILHSFQRFIEKGNGFYVALNIEQGTYECMIKAPDYQEKKMMLSVKNQQETDAIVCLLTPKYSPESICIKGKMYKNQNSYCNGNFYFTFHTMKYTGIIANTVKKGEKQIRFHFYNNHSLEGRKLAIEKDKGIYSIGGFDYMEKKYTIKEPAECDFAKGLTMYLLMEEQTKKNGDFEIWIPPHMIENSRFSVLFFVEENFFETVVDSSQKDIFLNVFV